MSLSFTSPGMPAVAFGSVAPQRRRARWSELPTPLAESFSEAGPCHAAALASLALASATTASSLRRRLWSWCERSRGSCTKVILRGVRIKSANSALDDQRGGFRVNPLYHGARSYGRVDSEDFEEAKRIRGGYMSDISTSQQAGVAGQLAAARQRLLLKRAKRGATSSNKAGAWASVVTGGAAASRSGACAEEVDEAGEEEPEESQFDDDSEGDEGDDACNSGSAESNGGADSGAGGNASSSSRGTTSRPARSRGTSQANFPGLAEEPELCSQPVGRGLEAAWSGWPAASIPATARDLAARMSLRSCSAAALQAGARALSTSGEHAAAAFLLQELRDFGVDREVLERRLDVSQAAALFQEAALLLCVELRSAGRLADAWEALMAACAEPELAMRWRGPSLEALLDLSTELAKRNSRERRVAFLQGAADAEAVLRALPHDAREGLEIDLALALAAAGQDEECREHLRALVSGSGTSPRRRQQAEWALLVQDADVGSEPNAAVGEMRAIFAEASPQLGGRGSAFASSAKMRQASGGGSGGSGVFSVLSAGSGESSLVLAAALLVLPLALPLVLSLRGDAH
ncbi:unnamed protein product [Polarella glacialis]|uniref:Uncharacterized protein n=1 Tax=Polarella glacialis TaxID=89957 RepID=A0A813LUB6_POLGL|nr:unnamed protein product [Polarella glacialis]